MKKLIVLVVLSLGVTLALTAAPSNELEYQKGMKKVGGNIRELRNRLRANDRPGAIRFAREMKKLFKQDEKFWAQRKSDDGVKWAREAQAAAQEIIAAAKKGEDDKAAVAMNTLTSTCAACHAVHREVVSGCLSKIK